MAGTPTNGPKGKGKGNGKTLELSDEDLEMSDADLEMFAHYPDEQPPQGPARVAPVAITPAAAAATQAQEEPGKRPYSPTEKDLEMFAHTEPKVPSGASPGSSERSSRSPPSPPISPS
jgi:hypothetical protein